MFISDYLRPENVLFQTARTSKMAVLRALIESLAQSGGITDIDACLSALLERERLMTTGVGKGVALPHAFSQSALDTVIGYLRVTEGVDFDAVDEKPVRHVFCILGPPSAQGRHLKILARLARLLNRDSFLQALDQAKSAEELLAACRSQEEALQPR
jgi:PTS system fructose-specific IIA component